MGGERARLMNTDPPYGIGYDSADVHEHGVSYARIDGDQHENERLQAFLEKAFAAALLAIRDDAAWYLWHAMLTQGFFAAAAAAAAAHVCLHRQIIWSKPVLVFGRGKGATFEHVREGRGMAAIDADVNAYMEANHVS